MPIDPKKFKKVINNHFDNLTEEEFLKTLHKSSPYLFDESSEEKRDVQLSEKSDMQSKSGEKADERYNLLSGKKQVLTDDSKPILFFRNQYFVKIVGILAVGSMLSVFAFNTFKTSNVAQAFTSENKFQCNVNEGTIFLVVRINGKNLPLIKFVNTEFKGTEYSSVNRCNEVNKRLNKYTSQSKVYITTGIRNGRSILCASQKIGEGCIKDDYGGEILSLGSSDTNAELYLEAFADTTNRDIFRDRSSILVQTQDRVYIGKQSLSTDKAR
jgi:Circadian oscillating protein COP23